MRNEANVTAAFNILKETNNFHNATIETVKSLIKLLPPSEGVGYWANSNTIKPKGAGGFFEIWAGGRSPVFAGWARGACFEMLEIIRLGSMFNSYLFKIINLTTTSCKVVKQINYVIETITPSGEVARVCDGIIVGLPEPQKRVLYFVTEEVAYANKTRRDLICNDGSCLLHNGAFIARVESIKP